MKLPAALPVLAVCNVLVMPGALLPLHVWRRAALAALDAARRAAPPLLAVLAQSAAETEEVSTESLHPVGCLAVVASYLAHPPGAFVVLEGLRWISLV